MAHLAPPPAAKPVIPGTTPFDGDQARKGYALNKMCFSFNTAENRAAFTQALKDYFIGKERHLPEEDALMLHPAVLECAVIGVPDAERGLEAAAAVRQAGQVRCSLVVGALP